MLVYLLKRLNCICLTELIELIAWINGSVSYMFNYLKRIQLADAKGNSVMRLGSLDLPYVAFVVQRLLFLEACCARVEPKSPGRSQLLFLEKPQY